MFGRAGAETVGVRARPAAAEVTRRRAELHLRKGRLGPPFRNCLPNFCSLAEPTKKANGTRERSAGGRPRLETMLLRASLRRCTASTLDLVRREPFKSALVVTTLKTVAADLLVQLAVQKQEWDARRTALFGAFGLIYQGAAQYVVVNIVIERAVNSLFPGHTTRAVVAKCAAMNGLADPLLFLPTFYVFKEAIQSRLHTPDFSTARCPLR